MVLTARPWAAWVWRLASYRTLAGRARRQQVGEAGG